MSALYPQQITKRVVEWRPRVASYAVRLRVQIYMLMRTFFPSVLYNPVGDREACLCPEEMAQCLDVWRGAEGGSGRSA